MQEIVEYLEYEYFLCNVHTVTAIMYGLDSTIQIILCGLHHSPKKGTEVRTGV